MKSYCSLGLMSGTSADGVDASVIQSDGDSEYKVILEKYFKYGQNTYENIHNLKEKINNSRDLVNFSKIIQSIEKEITLFHINDDGEIQNREWTINKIDENNYEGTAGDVVGKAIGYSYGPAFKFEYVLLVPVKGKEMKITFDDWIFKQDNRVAINRATMTKFGFKVAELTVVFVKD